MKLLNHYLCACYLLSVLIHPAYSLLVFTLVIASIKTPAAPKRHDKARKGIFHRVSRIRMG